MTNEIKFQEYWHVKGPYHLERIEYEPQNGVEIVLNFPEDKKFRAIRFPSFLTLLTADEGISLRTTGATSKSSAAILLIENSPFNDWFRDEVCEIHEVGKRGLKHWRIVTGDDCISVISHETPTIVDVLES